jgi:ABC-type uncharacterized transport system permease subunit
VRHRAGLARLAALAVRVSFSQRAAYRWDFLLSAVVALALEAVTPVVTLLIYGMGSSFPGWTATEALLIQGTFLLARGIAFPCFFGMVWTVFEGVREGTFELTLLKPRSPRPYIASPTAICVPRATASPSCSAYAPSCASPPATYPWASV